jgi:hypothetical protein
MLFILILFLCALSSLTGPWWLFVPAAFAAALLLAGKAWHAFFSGFLAVAGWWMICCLYYSIPNENLLATRMAAAMQVPAWTIVLIISVLIGGIAGGMSALSGWYLKAWIKKTNPVTA